MTRKAISIHEKLAATLLMLTDGNGRPLIEREQAKSLSAKEITSRFDFDHAVHVAIKGSNHPTNLTPRLRAEHREKTARVDVPQIAKTKRITKEHEAFQSRLLAKTGQTEDAGVRKRKGKPLPGTKASGLRKRMDGTVERR